jgi:NAD+ diphosphatase
MHDVPARNSHAASNRSLTKLNWVLCFRLGEMKTDPLLTSLLLSRSQLRRRNREIWKDIDWEAVKSNPATQVLVLASGKAATAKNKLVLQNVAEVDPGLIWVDLGIDQDSTPYVVAIDETAAPDDWQDLRQLGSALTDLEVALLVTSVAIANWHKKSKFCTNCGSQTVVETAGWTRRCVSCNQTHHPRTDPAIISLVVDQQDRALLGRRVDWDTNFYSTFAGFVEAGESAEMTLIRELREEAGVNVRYEDITYRGSQVWPFPASLMLGYIATVSESTAVADGYEIAEVRWFSRAELKAACDSGEIKLPSKISIARALIENWYGETLPDNWLRA